MFNLKDRYDKPFVLGPTHEELFTIAAVMACLAAAIVAVICYRLFMSSSGSTTIPGGFKFTWS